MCVCVCVCKIKGKYRLFIIRKDLNEGKSEKDEGKNSHEIQKVAKDFLSKYKVGPFHFGHAGGIDMCKMSTHKHAVLRKHVQMYIPNLLCRI